MSYNFDLIVSRRGTNCVKWDEATQEDVIPLWVADMDFPVYPAITEALHRRVDHPVFGYTHVPDSYYQAVARWFEQHHGWRGIQKSDIIYTTGVVPAISAIIRGLTLPGDKVLVQTPVYNCFFSSIRNQGCAVEENRLLYEEYTYSVDWDDFEKKCSDDRVRIFLLCNPHNPAGRVWTREELQRMGDICLKHGVFIIADEIHCELVMPDKCYTPFASISEQFAEHAAVCVAPTKAFNIAGLQIANVVVRSAEQRERINRAINLHEVCDVNPFGVVATEAAYTDGGWKWLQELNAYLFDNYRFLCDFISKELPQFSVVNLEGTYLAWIDCTALGLPSSKLADYLLQRHRVWFNDGEMYGATDRPFLRVNLACPRVTLAEGLRRMASGVKMLNHH